MIVTKPDGSRISCIMKLPEHMKGIVIAIHGFSSSKECATFQVLERKLPPAGLGMIGIDLPGHGRDVSYEETLRIEGCKNSIEAVEAYIRSHFPEMPIYYFASSFGAYITGLYMSTREHAGRKAFFRSAAVNMPSLFIKEDPNEEEREKLKKLETDGFFFHSLDDQHQPVKITREFYRDLEENDLFEIFDPDRYGHNQFFMAHGTEDTVIDPGRAKEFSERFHVPIRFFEHEGHSLGGAADTPDLVAELAVAFYLEDDAKWQP